MKTSKGTWNDGLAPGQTFARKFAVVLCVPVCLIMTGCRHKPTTPLLPAIVVAPVTPPPAPAAPVMKAPPPTTLSEMPAVKVTEAKPKPRTRKKTSLPVVAQAIPPPLGPQALGNAEGAPIASSTALSTLGELSAGSEANPRNQQEATELVVSSEHRLEALLKTKAGQQQEQTREIRHFLEQARQALTTGDAEGARTLATKARLLMDDLEKWAAQ